MAANRGRSKRGWTDQVTVVRAVDWRLQGQTVPIACRWRGFPHEIFAKRGYGLGDSPV